MGSGEWGVVSGELAAKNAPRLRFWGGKRKFNFPSPAAPLAGNRAGHNNVSGVQQEYAPAASLERTTYVCGLHGEAAVLSVIDVPRLNFLGGYFLKPRTALFLPIW